MTDWTIDVRGVAIATRDHGGEGSAVLLIPGAGRTLEDFTPIAPLLAAEHRVISMDVRCHGLSDTAPLELDATLDDVLGVCAHYGLEKPAIVGHSLGGMLAALLATRPGVLSGAVNLDGHGPGKPGQFVGLTNEKVAEMQRNMKAMTAAMTDQVLTVEGVVAMKADFLSQAQARGLSAELAAAVLDRTLSELPDGTFETRPNAASAAQMHAWLETLDLLAIYRATTVPLLVYNCTSTNLPLGLPGWVGTYLAAYRVGLRRDLTAMAEELPLVSTIELADSGHDLHLDHTEVVARQINAFLA